MNIQEPNNNLIEHIITLLNVPENSDTASDLQSENTSPGTPPSLLESQELETACGVITFMDEMPGGFLIYRADDNEQIIYANKALLRIFQCDTMDEFREMTGNTFRGLVHPEDLEEVEESIKNQIKGSQFDLDYVEYRITARDGSIRWIEDYGHFVHSDKVGDVFYVFIADATEKRNRQITEKNLFMEREKKIKNLLDEYNNEKDLINQEHLRRLEVIEGLSMNYESILYVDLDSDKVLPYRLSSRTEYQFDKTLHARGYLWYASDYIATWVHPDDREMVTQATEPDQIRQKLSESKTYCVNYRIIADGETQYLQLRIVNVGRQDHISQLVWGYRRIDEEVLREMEQKQLLEEALYSANLAIVAKNTFLSNMSHDMRTPLNAIFGYTALAKEHIDNRNSVQNYINKIETSSRELLALIEKVLEVAWTESNDIRISEKECNLCDVMQDLHQSMLSKALDKNIDFTINTDKLEHYDVFSDPDKLKQLLSYLIHNAVKFTNYGGKVNMTITEIENISNDFAVYQFVIKDNGIGISKDFLAHIFEPFEREKNTTFSSVYGTGLGLTIAKNIAEMMGGSIEAKSTVGKGSTFTVTLRLRIQNEPFSDFSDFEDFSFPLLDLKILLVEDNEINMEIETEILQGLGFFVETASDGNVAVKMVEESNPGDYDIVLMDIQMPEMNGRQATAAIRRLDNPALANIPIIALSANAFDSDKRMSLESGINAHLTKPIDVPLLLKTMKEILQAREN
ncbi:MAG: response regulator [Lachnospiraceae bacterium]|nr:response regulator [Lachnospiraceae bacterium]